MKKLKSLLNMAIYIVLLLVLVGLVAIIKTDKKTESKPTDQTSVEIEPFREVDQ